jgi:hypothetical protein
MCVPGRLRPGKTRSRRVPRVMALPPRVPIPSAVVSELRGLVVSGARRRSGGQSCTAAWPGAVSLPGWVGRTANGAVSEVDR